MITARPAINGDPVRAYPPSYRSGGWLAKYHAGYFGEPIVADSYE